VFNGPRLFDLFKLVCQISNYSWVCIFLSGNEPAKMFIAINNDQFLLCPVFVELVGLFYLCNGKGGNKNYF